MADENDLRAKRFLLHQYKPRFRKSMCVFMGHNQKNYHFLMKENEKHTFVTSKESPSFTIDGLPFVAASKLKYWIVVSAVVLSLLGYFLFKKTIVIND